MGKENKFDKFDALLQILGHPSEQYVLSNEEIDSHYEGACELAEEIGIQISNNRDAQLILWNDDVNDMLHVVLSLYEICKLDNEEAMRVMMEAHNKGKAIAKTGTYMEMDSMRAGLNDRNLKATIQQLK